MRRGSAEALGRIYEKYRDDLLRLAVSLSNDTAAAEDAVHDVFTAFIRQGRQFRLTGSLRGYLATCVANRVRNVNRTRVAHSAALLNEAAELTSPSWSPERWVVCSEELRQVAGALARLPHEQREVVTLHLQGGMKFREIAKFQHVPLKTALSRYHGGLQKLRTVLNGEVTECDR
ncbi:MAG: sigma-70 family RNA polymerase sigma factor [Sedimentisphaerales bacterium]|nr:sigma-70 family RNA polymerase sigma factor [Sedimentisphaerales bacterium]